MNAITMVWVLTWPRFIIPRHLKDRGSAPGGGWPASALAMDGETVRGYSHPQNLAEITLFRVFANRTAGWSSKHACLSMQNKTIWIATTISTTRLSRGLASKPSFGIFWGGPTGHQLKREFWGIPHCWTNQDPFQIQQFSDNSRGTQSR